MKVSLNWAQQVSDADITSIGIDQVVAKIGAQLGAVEEVIDWGTKYQDVLVVKVISCIKHPNADKLSVCMVDDGESTKNVERDKDGLVQVVCGAPNVKTGQTVVWLPPGCTVPSTFGEKPFVLAARELRGIMSNGMIASASELGISEDHNGILVIEEDIIPGTPFKDFYSLNDCVIDLENKMFTHRPDCFGILGVARELAGIQGKQFTSPSWYATKPIFDKAGDLDLSVNVKTKLVPRFSAIAVKNVKVGPSPTQIQSDLSRVGIRPINNIVDITNWLMHLTAQPLHAYDYDKIVAKSGGQANLTARLSAKGEKLELLNGKTIEFKDDETVLICAGKEPVGVGGVMGGADTEVDENTRNIIIECASFDMYNIRRTSMKYGLFTDAVTRFNKGQSPLQNAVVIYKALLMVSELSGGDQASPLIDYQDKSVALPPNVNVSAQFINTRLGSNLTSKQIAKTLQLVEFKVKTTGDKLTITVPFWRRDISLPEDIVEEVGRLIGYNTLPVSLPKRTASPVAKNISISFKYRLRDILASAGANEVLTYSFVHGDLISKSGQDVSKAYKLGNALSPDLHYYRLSLIPSLLDKIHPNIKAGFGKFAIFEVGKSHTNTQIKDGLPIESEKLAFVFTADSKNARQNDGQSYYMAKYYLDFILKRIGVNLEFIELGKASKDVDSQLVKPFYSHRSAIIQSNDGDVIGVIGEFNQTVLKSLKLPEFSAGFELDIKQLFKAAKSSPNSYRQLPKFPKVTQDISLKVNKSVIYADLEKSVKDALRANQPQDSTAQIYPIDIYQKDDIKHITFRLDIASYVKTLTAKEVNDLLDKIAEATNKRLKATRL